MLQVFILLLNFFVILIFNISLFSLETIDLLKYVADHHIHGYKDDYIAYEKAKEIIKVRKLQMSCTSISNFTINYLKENEVESRFILTLTLDEWNDYNNGHSMIEVLENGEWKLWDIDLKSYFVFDGIHLDAKTFCYISSEKSYEIIKFSNEDMICLEDLKSNNKDYTLWHLKTFLNEDDLRKFYERVCQIEMIGENGKFYFTSDINNMKLIKKYPYSGNKFEYLNRHIFNKKFYYKNE